MRLVLAREVFSDTAFGPGSDADGEGWLQFAQLRMVQSLLVY